MFPPVFVREQVSRYTRLGDVVLDPFSGRGTTLLEAGLRKRIGLASDVNPVAVCVTGAKANIPSLALVRSRIEEIRGEFKKADTKDLESERQELPAFFQKAFYYLTMREILFLRRSLDWHGNSVDRFIAALALGSLHGEMDRSQSYFSNQMPRTISTKPGYSLRFWKDRKLYARRRRVFDIMEQRANLRLGRVAPPRDGVAVTSDVRRLSAVLSPWERSVKLVVTSPPYLNVTDFEEDQWLRLWFLGGEPAPTRGRVSRDNRYGSATRYWRFLAEAWKGIANLLAPDAVIVCRIGGKGQTLETMAGPLMATIRGAFPEARLIKTPVKSEALYRQTNNFRPGSNGVGGEVDFTFRIT
jgi:hypothetical protein